ncbi:hypothetical protein [Lentzea sp. NBRC 102530]|uniref:hypothetical protein n=1 Tax=Lentzea sp. NBRC 102530 TaxID=3032201 RepID=UPI0024A25B7D|nr:hypothetical protein [Lentzea sp. NBRC 102530]GLY50515.1 hypothetical protein Lesp01_41710 [Lentzea sp. NBRC 102530]
MVRTDRPSPVRHSRHLAAAPTRSVAAPSQPAAVSTRRGTAPSHLTTAPTRRVAAPSQLAAAPTLTTAPTRRVAARTGRLGRPAVARLRRAAARTGLPARVRRTAARTNRPAGLTTQRATSPAPQRGRPLPWVFLGVALALLIAGITAPQAVLVGAGLIVAGLIGLGYGR